MSDLSGAIAVLGKPYKITRSRLGAITKVFTEQFLCDVTALQELFQSVSEKLASAPATETPTFSFLISFSDQTHHDGVTSDLTQMTTIPIGKQTERIVARWGIAQTIDEVRNELTITVRISNPINPLVFLQAALSKSPSDLDNFQFEMGSTCVTVDGATQNFSDEVFLRIQNWIEARNKPHSFLNIHGFYLKYEFYLDKLGLALLPFLTATLASLWAARLPDIRDQLTAAPMIFGLFLIIHGFCHDLTIKMSRWANRSRHISLFQITNGDLDALNKLAAKANNSALKLIASLVLQFLLNIAAGIACWWMTLPSAAT
ncbi:MAG: hypothetical protein J0H39_15440 [Alphaproteobacteria bacterium]|nr:hypothetical protein [Alphaproteobacteria bacterium]